MVKIRVSNQPLHKKYAKNASKMKAFKQQEVRLKKKVGKLNFLVKVGNFNNKSGKVGHPG